MKQLEQLAQSMAELAQLPETTQAAIQAQHGKLNTQDARIQHIENLLGNLPSKDEVENSIASAIQPPLAEFLESCKAKLISNPYEFVLENDEDGYADKSWESIIEQGQALQEKYWSDSEKYWQDLQGDSPSGPGWYGTAESPIITIKCIEPVYKFHNTCRLPGRFQVKGNGHWSSFLRFYGDGDEVLKDDNPWGVQTNAPIGIYVEPTTELADGRRMRHFEQSIQGVSLVAHNGSMPAYLSVNPFNFRMMDCNIQAHAGAKVSVKHGPAIEADWYPVKQIYPPNYQSVYLPDPVFSNILIEGPHKFQRKSCGILAGGNNMIFDRLNFYGHMCGLMLHGGQGRIVSNCTMHDGATGDGRHWVDKKELVLAHLIRDTHKNLDGGHGNILEYPIHVIDRGKPAPKGGWFNGGEVGL